MRVAVVGGGIAGLVSAYDLANAGADVTVFEANDRWGGKIFSSMMGERRVDAGPDNFLARVPDATELCEELGLGPKLTVPVSPVPAYIYRSGVLHRLPEGTMLGVPTDFTTLGGLISGAGIERARLDLTLPATPISAATSVDDYCRARLGDEVTDVLIDPMVGGINASSIKHLSLEQGAAQLFAAAQRSASLVEGLRSARASVGATLGSAEKGEPVFHGLEGGMVTLVEALVDHLDSRSQLRLRSPLAELPSGFDHVIVATEAHAAARLMEREHPEASELLHQIQHASVAQVTMEIPKEQIEPLDASGILVPRTEGMLMTACTWFSTKWAQYAASDYFLVRITSGRFKDQRAVQLSDAELIGQLTQDFGTVYADPGEPHSVRVVRWPNAFPQYQPGHAALVEEINEALAGSNLSVVGNSYRGIGIPATIKLARQTAASLLR